MCVLGLPFGFCFVTLCCYVCCWVVVLGSPYSVCICVFEGLLIWLLFVGFGLLRGLFLAFDVCFLIVGFGLGQFAD